MLHERDVVERVVEARGRPGRAEREIEQQSRSKSSGRTLGFPRAALGFRCLRTWKVPKLSTRAQKRQTDCRRLFPRLRRVRMRCFLRFATLASLALFSPPQQHTCVRTSTDAEHNDANMRCRHSRGGITLVRGPHGGWLLWILTWKPLAWCARHTKSA